MLQLIRPSLLPRELVRVAHSSLRFATPRHCFSSTAYVPSASSSTFSFVVGQAFHTKPTDSQPRNGPDGKPIKPVVQGFAPDSPIVRWRDEALKVAPWGAGHDWLFQEETPGGGVVCGVADGVGGWEESGVDPAFFAQSLMFYCREEVRRNSGDSLKSPREILREGYDGVLQEDGVLAGTVWLTLLERNTGLII